MVGLLQTRNKKSGSITLIVLLMLIVFVLIFTASIQFIARQSRELTDQEQEEQAFGLADSGVQYTLWLLSPNGGNRTPTDLQSNPPATLTDHAVHDADGSALGTFTVTLTSADSGSLALTSTGYDAVKTNRCQTITARLQRSTTGQYKITQWDNHVGYAC